LHVLTNDVTEHEVDDLIVENGTCPMDEVYFDLKSKAMNLGQLDQEALINGQNPFKEFNPTGKFHLARVGDAISSRNMHAAIFDALRICVNY
ncbi:MAG: N-methylproline demethylase, partial [Alphaproteobacteria bacterium]